MQIIQTKIKRSDFSVDLLSNLLRDSGLPEKSLLAKRCDNVHPSTDPNAYNLAEMLYIQYDCDDAVYIDTFKSGEHDSSESSIAHGVILDPLHPVFTDPTKHHAELSHMIITAVTHNEIGITIIT